MIVWIFFPSNVNPGVICANKTDSVVKLVSAETTSTEKLSSSAMLQ